MDTMKRLLRLPEVLSRTGLSRSTLYADATFPRSIKIGPRAVAWDEREIDDWIEARIEAREAAWCNRSPALRAQGLLTSIQQADAEVLLQTRRTLNPRSPHGCRS